MGNLNAESCPRPNNVEDSYQKLGHTDESYTTNWNRATSSETGLVNNTIEIIFNPL